MKDYSNIIYKIKDNKAYKEIETLSSNAYNKNTPVAFVGALSSKISDLLQLEIIEFTFHRVILKFNHNLAIKLPLCKEGIEDNIKELELYNNSKENLKELLNPSLYLAENILVVENYSKIHYLPEEIHNKVIEALKENNLKLKDDGIVDCYGKNKDKNIVLTDYTFC